MKPDISKSVYETYDESGLKRLSLSRTYHTGIIGATLSLDQGITRARIAEILQRDENYVFRTTSANTTADSVLRQFIGFRKNMEDPWKVRRIRPEDDVECDDGFGNQGNALKFSSDLMETYLSALDELAKQSFPHASFSLVQHRGIMWPPCDSIYHPVAHVVPASKEKIFRDLVFDLNGDEAYEVIKRRENPQNYRLAEVDKLRELQVNPLVIKSRVWRVKSSDLVSALEFLVPHTIIQEHHRPEED